MIDPEPIHFPVGYPCGVCSWYPSSRQDLFVMLDGGGNVEAVLDICGYCHGVLLYLPAVVGGHTYIHVWGGSGCTVVRNIVQGSKA